MSHTRTIKMQKLGKVKPKLVEDAVKAIARQHGLQVVRKVRRYVGGEIGVHIGVQHSTKLPYGVGVQIGADGTAQFIGDDWGGTIKMHQLQKDFETLHYPTVAARRAMQQMGFAPTTKITKQGVLTVGEA